MAYDIYDASIPPLIHMLGSLSNILSKGESHGGIDPGEARLAPVQLERRREAVREEDGRQGGHVGTVAARLRSGRWPCGSAADRDGAREARLPRGAG